MKATLEENPIVQKWLDGHKGFRVPIRVEGQFESFTTSRAATCWGQEIIVVKGVKIGVSQPSPQRSGDPAPLFYDYVVE